MSYTQSSIALEAAIKEYYEGLVSVELQAIGSSTVLEATPLSGVGAVFHYSLKSIMEEAKKLTHRRAKFMISKEGEPAGILALTSDEETDMIGWIKDATVHLLMENSSAFREVENATPVEGNAIVNVYTIANTSFLRGEMWSVTVDAVPLLYRCLVDTLEAPSGLSNDWLLIEDGEKDRVYFLMLLHVNWDQNTSDTLDRSIFMALVSYILKEWYSTTGIIQDEQRNELKYRDYIRAYKSATFQRIKGITRRCSTL